MKKLFCVLFAVVLMMALSVTAFAAISPEGGVIPPDDSGTPGENDSPMSPPTGVSVVLLVSTAAASLTSAGFAVKKLSEKN